MRVLHLYSGNLYGGIETLLGLLAGDRALCPSMEPRFALCFEGRLSAELRQAGVEPHLLGPVRLTRPHTVLRARRALGRLLGSTGVDVVISHAPWVNVVFGPVLRQAGVPIVQWVHNPLNDSWVDRWSRRLVPDLVLCNSRYTAGAVASLFEGVDVEWVYPPVRPAPSPVSAAIRAEVRSAVGTAPDAVVIAQASRLEPWKGHRSQLQALATLAAVPGWVLWVIGGAQRPIEAAYRAELETLASNLGIGDRVRFLGERDDVARLLSAADIYCQPNTEAEPFGIVFVEALAAGLPVVSTDLGGPSEVVDARCGCLVPPSDVGALAATLERLVTGPAARRTLGSAGPARASALTDPAGQMRKLADLIRPVATVAR